MTHTLFVTGGTGFIGQQLLATLTRQGHNCLLLMRQPHKLPELKLSMTQLGGDGRRLHAIPGDLGQPGLGLDGAGRQACKMPPPSSILAPSLPGGWIRLAPDR